MISSRSRWIFLPLLTLVLPLHAFAAASTVTDILNVQGNQEVSRAAFLKASVIVLGLPVTFDAAPRGYRAYAPEIRDYVRAADKQQAFGVFGTAPDLSKTISRGEAIRLISALYPWQGSGAAVTFRDVPAGGESATAVQRALQEGWVGPLRKNVFGVDAPLHAKEARSLLVRVSTDATAPSRPTSAPIAKRQDAVGFVSKKFRTQVQSLLRNEYLYAEKLKSATGSTAQEFVKSIKDPYTTLFDEKEAKMFSDQLKGTVTGIGVHLNEDQFEVMSVVEQSPAARAGILAGDRIVSVNQKRVEGMTFNDVINRIRGREGTPVRIGISRNGDELSFDIRRAAIDIPDTKLEMRNHVAILTISQFGDHLLNDAPDILQGIADLHPEGIVLDLRFNPGGYLQGAASLLSEILPKGSVYLLTRGRTVRETYVTHGDPSIPSDIPMVVLTNASTASSAEIVAGALQDYGRATIIGKKTFGKGTVQQLYPFDNKSSLKFTVAEWFTPDEHPINAIGITPDVDISQSDAGDPQLEKALEILRGLSR